MVAMLAGLPGMKGLYQPVKVDSKAIQEFMAFYHILKQQPPFRRIMQYSGQIPTMMASVFWENRGAELIHAKFNRLGLVFAPICCA